MIDSCQSPHFHILGDLSLFFSISVIALGSNYPLPTPQTHTSLYIQIIFIKKTPYYLRIQKNEPIRFDISGLSTSCLIGMSVQTAAELRRN